MSCIAMSVGLGNVWRFPFTALENGGGAFLIPYLIVLLVVGRPIYYLEMIVGQFSSRGSAKVYDLCPAMRGRCAGARAQHRNSFHATFHIVCVHKNPIRNAHHSHAPNISTLLLLPRMSQASATVRSCPRATWPPTT